MTAVVPRSSRAETMVTKATRESQQCLLEVAPGCSHSTLMPQIEPAPRGGNGDIGCRRGEISRWSLRTGAATAGDRPTAVTPVVLAATTVENTTVAAADCGMVLATSDTAEEPAN